jgi:hypothetical protein
MPISPSKDQCEDAQAAENTLRKLTSATTKRLLAFGYLATAQIFLEPIEIRLHGGQLHLRFGRPAVADAEARSFLWAHPRAFSAL